MVLGTWSCKDTLYGEGYSLLGNGDLPQQLRQAIDRLPEFAPLQASPVQNQPTPAFTPPPPDRHIGEGSFFVGDDRTVCQSQGGEGVPVVYGGSTLKSDGTLVGKRLTALIGLRNHARRVLQSQNEGWPETARNGRNCLLAAHTGISGSCVVGDGVAFGGRAGIADHVHIADGARVAAAAGVMKDIGAGEMVAGLPTPITCGSRNHRHLAARSATNLLSRSVADTTVRSIAVATKRLGGTKKVSIPVPPRVLSG